jgi:hypothetical protein
MSQVQEASDAEVGGEGGEGDGHAEEEHQPFRAGTGTVLMIEEAHGRVLAGVGETEHGSN